MNNQELLCPVCQQQYSTLNPPRLLTMCGHTFCQKCIKTFITRKKQKGFRIKCPVDKVTMQMDKPNPSFFPKNMILVNFLIKNKSQSKQADDQNQFLDVSVCTSVLNDQDRQFPQDYKSSITIFKQQTILASNPAQTFNPDRYCKQHHKKLQIFCVNQMKKICTDCAIFGLHRNHDIKNIEQALAKQKQAMQSIQNIMQQKRVLQNKLNDKQIQNQVLDLLDNKKKMVKQQINSMCRQLKAQIDQKQNNLNQQLQQKVMIIAQRLRNKKKPQMELENRYSEWMQKVNLLLNYKIVQDFYLKQQSILGIQTQEPTKDTQTTRLRQFFQNDQYMQVSLQGTQFIQTYEAKQKCFLNSVENEVNGLKLYTELQTLINCLKTSNKIQIQPHRIHLGSIEQRKILSNKNLLNLPEINACTQMISQTKQSQILPSISFILLNDNKQIERKSGQTQQMNQQTEQQCLLDFDQNSFQEIGNLLCQSTNNLNKISNISILSKVNLKNQPFTKIRESISQSSQPEKILKIDKKLMGKKPTHTLKSTIQKKNEQNIAKLNLTKKTSQSTLIPDKKRSTSINLSMSASSSMLTPRKNNIYSKSSKKLVGQTSKYSMLINQILQNRVQTVDLTGAQLSLQSLTPIVQAISKSQGVKTLKLMRNKLDDKFIDKLFINCINVEKVNIAQNKLSPESVEKVIKILSQEPHKMNYLNLGQNKIVQRKNRKVLQQFKKMGINVIL